MNEGIAYAHLILVCLGLAFLTVVIHMSGLFVLRHWIRRLLRSGSFSHHVMRETFVVSALVIGLCVVHLTEVLAWAWGYLVTGALASFNDALYFSLTTYTTVGSDGVSIPRVFRGIAGFESLLGPMMVAWSTAFMVEYVTRVITPDPQSKPRNPS
ncbi:ion channel [Xanthobacter sp. V0B-10]|uniref:ion channel n=1 Tax=Xanthobacter albus TaxID=3119929 RepID=UPI0037266CAC